MIIVIFLICVGVLVLGGWLTYEWDCEISGGMTMTCGTVGGVISFIAFIVFFIWLSYILCN